MKRFFSSVLVGASLFLLAACKNDAPASVSNVNIDRQDYFTISPVPELVAKYPLPPAMIPVSIAANDQRIQDLNLKFVGNPEGVIDAVNNYIANNIDLTYRDGFKLLRTGKVANLRYFNTPDIIRYFAHQQVATYLADDIFDSEEIYSITTDELVRVFRYSFINNYDLITLDWSYYSNLNAIGYLYSLFDPGVILGVDIGILLDKQHPKFYANNYFDKATLAALNEGVKQKKGITVVLSGAANNASKNSEENKDNRETKANPSLPHTSIPSVDNTEITGSKVVNNSDVINYNAPFNLSNLDSRKVQLAYETLLTLTCKEYDNLQLETAGLQGSALSFAQRLNREFKQLCQSFGKEE